MESVTRPLMRQILPAGVAVAELLGPTVAGFLFPEEAAFVRRAVEKRRREFAAGRACARRALEDLGRSAVPILAGPDREPIWPAGIVGSVTHCLGYTAAAVAEGTEVVGLGIDSEINTPLPAETIELILSDDERRKLDRLPAKGVCWDRLVASAKESVFKAWFPWRRRWLDFRDVEVTVAAESGSWTAKMATGVGEPEKLPWQHWRGQFWVGQGLILTSVWVKSTSADD